MTTEKVQAAAVVGEQYGVGHIENILDVVVAGVDGYKSIKKEDPMMQKVSKFVPTLIALAGALESFGKAGPEFKDIDPSEIEALRTKYMPKFGVEGKVGVYVSEGLSIIMSGLKILKAK